MKYNNLKSKTIFDFCDDEKLIAELIVVPKETYKRELNQYPLINAHTLIEYAELTKNADLLAAVKEQYKDELAKERNE